MACYVPSHFSYAIHICSLLVKLQYKASLLLHETVNIFEVRLKVVVVFFLRWCHLLEFKLIYFGTDDFNSKEIVYRGVAK